MADASNWTRAHPSGSSQLRDFDDLYRSDKSIFEAGFLEEHYWKDGSAASAGRHKLGSARVYSDVSSNVSVTGEKGRLMWDETNSHLVALHAASFNRIPALNASNQFQFTANSASTLKEVVGYANKSTASKIGFAFSVSAQTAFLQADWRSASASLALTLGGIAGATYQETLTLTAEGSAVIGTAALGTTATDGFLYIPTSAGAPTGTPTSYTGRAPLHVDTTNGRLYVYYGGAWHYTALT